MSNPNKPGSATPPVNEKSLSQILEVQLMKVKNDAKELEIKTKHLDHQARYADKWLGHQAEILKDQPNQHRKSLRSLTKNVCLIMAIVFIFIGFCLWLNKDAFVIELIKAAGYVITTIVGYYFGRKTGRNEATAKNSDNNPEPYQEVN